jgi:hypothetical protein
LPAGSCQLPVNAGGLLPTGHGPLGTGHGSPVAPRGHGRGAVVCAHTAVRIASTAACCVALLFRNAPSGSGRGKPVSEGSSARRQGRAV